jgi:hypothetical protein
MMGHFGYAAMIVQLRDFQLENEQRDDDCENSVAKRFDPGEAQFAGRKTL